MLTTALHQLASIELRRGDGDAALEVYREAIEWQQKIVAMPQHNDFDQANLAALHQETAKVLAELGPTEQALTHYATAAQRWEPLPLAAASFHAADSYWRGAKLAAASGTGCNATGSGVVFGQRPTLWRRACPKTTPDPFRRCHQEVPERVLTRIPH